MKVQAPLYSQKKIRSNIRMVKWKKMNKKMAGLLLGVMMLFTASTTAFAYVDESAEASKVETTQTDQSTDKEEKKDKK